MANRLLSLLVLAIWAGAVPAANFCVGDAASLSVALDVADNNAQSDTVQLQQGVYQGNFNYDANLAETGDLSIAGGFTPGCLTRDVDASNTVLQGAGGRTLRLNGRDNSNLLLDGVTVRGGQSQLGGAGLDIGRWIDVTVTNNVFTANQTTAGFDGSGGTNIDRSITVTVARNQFLNNTGGKGGGLSLSDPVSATIDANLFLGNHAEQDGGAIDADSAGHFVITNNVIAANSSAEDAGAIGLKLFVDGTAGSADLVHNTITANSAAQEGGGVDLKMIGDSPVVTLYNNIVYNNNSGLPGRDLFIDNDDERNGIAASVVLLNNDFDQSFFGTFMAIPFPIDASNLNNIDPLFRAPAVNDYKLQAGSPVIDAGTPAATPMPATDFDGGSRIVGAAPDIGAYETAAVVIDTDGDGISDESDNCTVLANPSQLDSNGDGFGNACDPDLDNNGLVNFSDLALMELAFFSTPVAPGWNPDADFNGDNFINFTDLLVMSQFFFGTPGPSGLNP